jgi:hypothetical protein
MRFRLSLIGLLAVIAVVAFAQNPGILTRQPVDEQRIRELEKKASILQDRVSQLEEQTGLHYKPLSQTSR